MNWLRRDGGIGPSAARRQPGLRVRQMLVAAAALPLLASVAVALTPDIAAADGPVAIVGRTPTKLVAAPISVVHTVTSVRLTYSARLTVTATGAPIANQFILFSDVAVIPGPSPLRNLLCETQTNSNGVARCTVNILGVLNVLEKPAYRATYFGNDTYFPAVGTGVVGP